MQVDVVYALPAQQRVVRLELPEGTTAREAALQSGLDRWFADLDLATQVIGVFGECVDDSYPLQQGDRVELYRPLEVDPMDARRRRAAGNPPPKGPRDPLTPQ